MQTGTMTIAEIADQLVVKFPQAFADRNTAIGRAGDLATTYAKPGHAKSGDRR